MYFNRYHYIWFVPIGFVFTSIIQSSSATVAILLSALYNNLIPFENAAAIIVGSELGTTMKFLISSIGGMPDQKRVAWGNFILNFTTMIFGSILIAPLIWFIREFMGVHDNLISLVFFQTGINLISILIFYPILEPFAKLLEKLFNDPQSKSITKYIGKTILNKSGDPLIIAEKEFYSEFQILLNLSGDKTTPTLAENLNIKNRKQYETFIENSIEALKENKINELDSSNLLNVHHEIYSSNQSLIKALTDLIEIDSQE